MPTLTIDNQTITVSEGKTILEAAEALGIMVPHFCYHKELGAVGACRMCAVTVHSGQMPGLKMACLVPVEEGMVVTTGDEASATFRDRVGEWLMLNHPHDCPVCDEGGECQLQEMTISSGHGIRRYQGDKGTYTNQDLGPFIAQEMNRCIQCYRCARTYKDYCGGRDFGVMGSRNRVFFGRFKDGMLESDFSGNLVDVCPTGVFTDRTFRFKSRSWDLEQADSVCPHCGVGCATIPGGRLRELQRVCSGDNPQVNATFICDRGRFGSGYVSHPERPRQARHNDQVISIDDALIELDAQIGAAVQQHGPEAVLLLGSDRASLETNWLLQSAAKHFGCRVPVLNAHARRHQTAQMAAFDFSASLASLEDIRNSDLTLVFGVDPLAEAPILALALRQMVRKQGRVLLYDPRPVELPCDFDHQAYSPAALQELLEDGGVEGRHLRDLLAQAERPVIVAGADLLGPRGLQLLQGWTTGAANAERPCRFYPVLAGANSFGTALLSLPEQDDLLTRLEGGKVKMLVCVENDPLLEAPLGERFAAALTRLDSLVVVDYLPTSLGAHANLFVPSCPPFEDDGTFINNEGRLRRYRRVLKPGLTLAHTDQGGHPPREFSLATPGSEPMPTALLLQRLIGQKPDMNALHRQMVEQQPRLEPLLKLKPGDPGVRVGSAVARPQNIDKLPEQPAGTFQMVVSAARYGSDLLSRFAEKLAPRLTPTRLGLHPDDLVERGLKDGAPAVVETDFGSFKLTVASRPGMAAGCALVENSGDCPQLIPGAELSYCHISPGGADE
ncbi:MAG: NADH-quinone oxidoreductase subunit NuoG [Pelovirga sp.]